jgi:hypothetical protein
VIPLPPDGYCPRCRENVTPVRDTMTSKLVCPWCDGPVADAFDHERRWCPTCDEMVVPANDGGCWRCGSRPHRGPPWDRCGCGCGQLIRRFDEHGRRVRWVRGHAPRSLERPGEVDAEPFARYLEARLRDLDRLGAVAREHGIARHVVVAVLRRDAQTVPREVVRRALRSYGQNGRGMLARPDAASFFDLYPGDRRARTCPGCGKGKAPHAALCKACRRKAGYPRRKPRHSVGPEVLAAAARDRAADGTPWRVLAERYIARTPYTNVGSLAGVLRTTHRDRVQP